MQTFFKYAIDSMQMYFLPKHFKDKAVENKSIAAANKIKELAETDSKILLTQLKCTENGLNEEEVEDRLSEYGINKILDDKKIHPLLLLLEKFKNPLTFMLLLLAATSLYLDDVRAAAVIGGMTMISVLLSFFQELKSSKAAEALNSMVSTVAYVRRQIEGNVTALDVPVTTVVPGEIVLLSAGDIVPADIRILSSKDLFVNQATLTGEAMPVEKSFVYSWDESKGVFDTPNICFMGSNIESGSAVGVTVLTGKQTYLGAIAQTISTPPEPTSFDIGVKKFTWMMITFMLVMVPVVMLTNGFLKHDWAEAFLFGLSVAVGLAPEMLPMIVTVNLGKGALMLSRQKVIVKNLNSIQNFGAMDVLCTDKTGTLTQDKIVLERHIDINGDENEHVLELAYLNSYHQTGLKNLLDVAVLEHAELQDVAANVFAEKIDEIPFDFIRKRMSVVVEKNSENEEHLLITKGAVEEMLKLCVAAEVEGDLIPFDESKHVEVLETVKELNEDGFRVVAVAYKFIPDKQDSYSVADESAMILAGFIAFLDPPKDSAIEAIKALHQHGVVVKVLTGDNEIVTRKVCKDVGLDVKTVYKGQDIDAMNEEQLHKAVEEANIFAKLSPDNKARIVRALRDNGHVVGFMGDGINDAPALRAADVGISVDSAVDIAKESADIILLEKSLLVLEHGVLGGRQVFGNIIKYIKMGASSNFGNMFSVLGASIFLPFLPMIPIQILTNNFLYDLSQAATPTDKVDEEFLARPRKWEITDIRNFMLIMGPVSSIFDYVTFGLMLWVFNCWDNPSMFQTGWFVESLISQTIIVHIIRTNRIPFIQSVASLPVILMTTSVMLFGLWLPFSPIADSLGLVQLPPLYYAALVVMMIAYMVLGQFVKMLYLKKLTKAER